MVNDRTPLLQDHARNFWEFGDQSRDNLHIQFCKLIGIPPSELIANEEPLHVPKKSLYGRALRLKKAQQTTYAFTAALSNTLLLSQVVLGAALTALGASESSHVLITLFGAANTIIAGVVAYLKSRGQPMRARMFRDDLERVVDEIENSEIMWRDGMAGISKNMHGYDEIDITEQVTVRSEVARLTRLYDRAVRTNTMNNPDMYQSDGYASANSAALKSRPAAGPALPTLAPDSTTAPANPVQDPDESPASAPPKPAAPKPTEPESSQSTTGSDDTKGISPTETDNKGKVPA